MPEPIDPKTQRTGASYKLLELDSNDIHVTSSRKIDPTMQELKKTSKQRNRIDVWEKFAIP